MWARAYVEEAADGKVEILLKTNKGFYRVWVLPGKEPHVEVMVDGVLRGRAKGKLKPLEEE